MRRVGATLHRGARASHYRGLSFCGAQAPDAQAQQLWLTGLVALRHVGSSQTRARTCVPCVGRQILNHCATREALLIGFIFIIVSGVLPVWPSTFLHLQGWMPTTDASMKSLCENIVYSILCNQFPSSSYCPHVC